MKSFKFAEFYRNITGGVVAAVVALPILLSCGFLAYAPLGHEYATVGVSAAFVVAVLAALISGAFGGHPLMLNTPKTTHATMLAGLPSGISLQPAFSSLIPSSQGPMLLMAVALLALLVSGLTQTLLGGFKLGALVKFVPYPVISGFINGFAIQIILGQLPNVFGQDNFADLVRAFEGSKPLNAWPVGFSVLAAGLCYLSGKKSTRIPPAIIGMVGGTVAHLVAGKIWPTANLGPVIGTIPQGLHLAFHFNDLKALVSSPIFSGNAFEIVATGMTLAMVSSIQSLLSLTASEQQFEERANSNKELVIQGVTNTLSALLGGTPSGGTVQVTRALYDAGGRTQIAHLTYAVVLAAFAYGLSSLIASLPLSVMAGVVILLNTNSLDKWTKQILVQSTSKNTAGRRDLVLNLLVVVLVTFLVVKVGSLAALGTGLISVFFVFLYRSNAHMVRSIKYANSLRSSSERPHAAMRLLEEHGHRIAILKLVGPIFFGSAETVAQIIEKEAKQVDFVILDLKQCSHFDSSGVMMLKRMDEQLAKDGKVLILANLAVGGNRRRFLTVMGASKFESQGRVHHSLDVALSVAEDALLQKLDATHFRDENVTLAEFAICDDVTPEEITLLQSVTVVRVRAVGQTLELGGEQENSFFLLVKGNAGVYSGSEGNMTRHASYKAGMINGGRDPLRDVSSSRSAIVATTNIIVRELTADAMKKLDARCPGLQLKLMRNLAADLSYRVGTLNSRAVKLQA